MKKEPDDPNERAKKLDELKRSVEDLERAVAEWHSHNPEDVEREFREWERKYKAEVGYDSADPAIQELIDGLLEVRLKSLLKEAAEAKKNPPAPAEAEKPRPAISKEEKEALPDKIILLLDEYEEIGTGMHLSDAVIARKLEVDIREIQEEMPLLESKGLLTRKKEEKAKEETKRSYGAKLTVAGRAKVRWLKATPVSKAIQ